MITRNCCTSHVSQQINLLFPPSTARRYDMDFARHTQTHKDTDTDTHQHTNTDTDTHTHTHNYIYTSVALVNYNNIHDEKRIHTGTCTYCIDTYMYIYTHTCTYIYIHDKKRIHTSTCTYIHIHDDLSSNIHVHVNVFIQV